MRKSFLVFLILLACYVALQVPLTRCMAQRPLVVRLGYIPDGRVLRVALGDQRLLASEFSMLRLMLYFGSLVESWKRQVLVPPEYFNMYRTAEAAIKLDPYNMDAYYFSQAAFTWEVGHAGDVNRLLKYGMKYRHWDWYLPYFIGFNAAYFLKDFKTGADYMRQAAELSGNALLARLSARYFYESGRSELGIAFLRSMIGRERDPKVRQAYQLRLQALERVHQIEKAVAEFRQRYQRLPKRIEELVALGLLPDLPADPYGGTFFLDASGRVRSNSNFSKIRQ
ncbi:tetratricopeptide repeat protein [Geothermobacter hydrogeniphilus]|uniref:Tetratricopeptide repeat protein n=1 Tax=Geothermobacter hydrogeniphilus TaxID=1969733 RepID=A0A1X0Y1Q7_9BACT|nr:hypothetical protein [Geothermobacter hydrogeniphilus]ORJ59125.1 hypothetical protein B5V00_11190 [Geothermobacter hydrogeniphilus]